MSRQKNNGRSPHSSPANSVARTGTFAVSTIRFLKRHRNALGGSLGEYALIALIYSILTVIITNFTLLHPSTQLFTGGVGDATAGFLWLNYADPGVNPMLGRTDLTNYPYGQNLGSPTFITYSALWIPLRIFSYMLGPIAGLNSMMFIGFMTAALFGYWLIKKLTGSRLIAFFGGYAIAFVPYNIYKSVAHLAYLYCAPFVCIIAAFYGVWRRPTALRALLLAIATAWAYYTDGYYLLIASVTIAALLLVAGMGMYIHHMSKSEIIARIKGFGVAAGILMVLFLPIIYVQLSQGGEIRAALSSSRPSDPESEMRAYRSWISDLLLPSREHPVFSQDAGFSAATAYKELRSTPSEAMNYMGWSILLLSLVGIILLGVYRWNKKNSSLNALNPDMRRKVIFFGVALLIVTPIFLMFMFSPGISIRNHPIYFPGHYMATHGIAFWRVLARFFIPLHIFFVIFSSLVLAMFYSGELTKKLGKVWRLAVVWLIIGVMAFEYLTCYNRPSFDITKLPQGYSWLKNQSNIAVVAELPMVDALDGKTALYATAQIVHGKKLVNMKDPSGERLNNAIGTTTNSESINLAYDRGAQAIITHDQPCDSGPLAWGGLLYDETKHNSREQMCIYKLERPVENDKKYVVFGEGFVYTPVRAKPYDQSALIAAPRATFSIKDSSLTKSAEGKATFHGLIRYFSGERIKGNWKLKQAATTIAEGGINDFKTRIADVALDATIPVTIEVAYETLSVKDVTTYLEETKVN